MNWYAILEYADYELGSLCEFSKQPFTEGQVKHLMKQLLSGLAALHSHWIVHRDLKMPNLLINREGVLKVEATVALVLVLSPRGPRSNTFGPRSLMEIGNEGTVELLTRRLGSGKNSL